MQSIELTDTSIQFHGVEGLLLLLLGLAIVLFCFRIVLFALAGRRKDWAVQLIFWVGVVGVILGVWWNGFL